MALTSLASTSVVHYSTLPAVLGRASFPASTSTRPCPHPIYIEPRNHLGFHFLLSRNVNVVAIKQQQQLVDPGSTFNCLVEYNILLFFISPLSLSYSSRFLFLVSLVFSFFPFPRYLLSPYRFLHCLHYHIASSLSHNPSFPSPFLPSILSHPFPLSSITHVVPLLPIPGLSRRACAFQVPKEKKAVNTP
ncbi:unnamed protein product [Cyclocybe aegerita]|uniref:Uncharacterized protein n=1 Tax=Cyclocybe aegerita TaxID=1973307 RepID=A0A8S0VYF2_CYCAE|nr:unnamed protein product [Cyclocybe aegerita]